MRCQRRDASFRVNGIELKTLMPCGEYRNSLLSFTLFILRHPSYQGCYQVSRDPPILLHSHGHYHHRHYPASHMPSVHVDWCRSAMSVPFHPFPCSSTIVWCVYKNVSSAPSPDGDPSRCQHSLANVNLAWPTVSMPQLQLQDDTR